MEYYAPPLTDQDFNKPVGRYSQSIFQASNTRALTGTSLGNLVVWDNNQVLTKGELSGSPATFLIYIWNCPLKLVLAST